MSEARKRCHRGERGLRGERATLRPPRKTLLVAFTFSVEAYIWFVNIDMSTTTCNPQRHTECLSPPRPPRPNQPGTSGLWVHGMGKPPQYRVQRTSTDFCVPPREPFRPISTTGGLWGDGRASEAIATPTGGPPSRIRRSKASGGGAGCRAVATRGCGAAGAFRGFGE